MANIEDYLDWRSDISFDVDPFNEIDNLILSVLVYSPFDGLIPGPSVKEKIALEDLSRAFFEKFSEEELLARNTFTKMAPFLLKKMAKTKRYSKIKVAGFVNELDDSTQSQFACMTFYLPDNTIYVAFRGTDDTLLGWREDFNLSFSKGTGGQLKAVSYLNQNFSRTMKAIRLGGHSKGANFAVYAGAFCRDSVKDNIISIYSNDGPGFVNEIVTNKQYKDIKSRVISIIPEQSIVGMLMEHGFKNKVVSSNSKGINQHDAFSWQVVKNRFVEAPLSEFSIVTDEVIKKWVVNFDYKTRLIFGDIVFSSLESGGQTRLSQVTSSKLQSAAQITKAIYSLDKEQQNLFFDVIKKLVSVGGEIFTNTIMEKISHLSKSKN